ncbi:MAG: HAMP domain-containing histidine kinase [Bacteroidales bacterium]|nr:HAMP domain-containing histidine kinase [Bacteroidales bacterium]
MNFNKYHIKLLASIVLSSTLGAIAIWTFTNQDLVISRYIVLLIWVLSILLFFKYIYDTSRIMKDFISNIQEGDIISLPNTKNALGKEFNSLICSLNKQIKTISLKKEEQYHLFSTAVNQSGSGIIVFDTEGSIELINKSANNLFSKKPLNNINEFSEYNKELPKKLKSNKEQSFIISIQSNNELLRIAIHQNQFKLNGKHLKVVSIQNISTELDKEELEAWKKLMHVITHEIMNSVTPMKTLAYSLFDIFKFENKPKSLTQFDQVQIDDTFLGLKAINNRVNGLMKFVESYRKLYKIPNPVFNNFMIQDVLDEIKSLYKEEFLEKNIHLEINNENQKTLFADKNMITQLMINLIKNAIEAVEKSSNPKISIAITNVDHQTNIIVSDNGSGISEDVLKDIFVPFYTTKTNGSGIGLYYSKMIIYMHKGSINVKSEENKGTSFSIHI